MTAGICTVDESREYTLLDALFSRSYPIPGTHLYDIIRILKETFMPSPILLDTSKPFYVGGLYIKLVRIMQPDQQSTIPVTRETRQLVKRNKRGGESYDELLRKMVRQYNPEVTTQ